MRPQVAALRRPFSIRRLRSRVTPGPRLRRRLLVAVLIVALLGGFYLFWLRDSALVAVEDVVVTGLTGRDAERIRLALTSTATTMTTLNVDRDRLDRAAAAFPSVGRVEATPDFPHGLRLHVVERRPAAIARSDGRSQPVAADGSVLAGVEAKGDLPTIELAVPMPARRLGRGAARDAVAVAGAAPAAIAARVESLAREGGARGVVAQLDDGTELVFGAAERLAAKWAAAVRVLADDEAVGATYVDVRIPERPVAGGLAATTTDPLPPASEVPQTPVPQDPTYAQP